MFSYLKESTANHWRYLGRYLGAFCSSRTRFAGGRQAFKCILKILDKRRIIRSIFRGIVLENPSWKNLGWLCFKHSFGALLNQSLVLLAGKQTIRKPISTYPSEKIINKKRHINKHIMIKRTWRNVLNLIKFLTKNFTRDKTEPFTKRKLSDWFLYFIIISVAIIYTSSIFGYGLVTGP